MIDAGEIINEKSWIDGLKVRLSEIQDPRIIEVLQS